MLRLLADENVDRAIVLGFRQRCPGNPFLIAQEVGLTGLDDSALLAWAAANDCIVVSYDSAGMPGSDWQRISRGEPFPGLFILHRRLPVAAAIEELSLIACTSRADEWRDRVEHLPL